MLNLLRRWFSVFLLLTTCAVSAQNLFEGPAIRYDKKVPTKIIGKSDSSFYVLRQHLSNKTDRYFIEEYSLSDLSRKKSSPVSIELEKKSKLLEVFYTGDIFVFLRSVQKHPETTSLVMQTVSRDGKADPELLEIFSERTIILPKLVINGTFSSSEIKFSCSLSPDGRSLLAVSKNTSIDGEGKKTVVNFSAKLLDLSNRTEKWQKTIPQTYNDSRIASWSFKTDNEENIFFLFNYVTEKNIVQLAAGFIAKDNRSITGLDIVSSTGLRVDDVDYLIKDDQIYCSGVSKKYYDAPPGRTVMQGVGVFSQIINKRTFSLVTSDHQALPAEIVAKIDMERISSDDNYYANFRLQNMEIVNSELYSVAELYYPYSALVLFKTNKEGKIEWVNSVNRKYTPAGNGFQYQSLRHYHFFSQNNKLYLIFNENTRNRKSRAGTVLHEGELRYYKAYEEVPGTFVISTAIGPDGIIGREVLFKNKKLSLWFLPRAGSHIVRGLTFQDNLILPLQDSAIIYLKRDKGKGLFTAKISGPDKFAKLILK